MANMQFQQLIIKRRISQRETPPLAIFEQNINVLASQEAQTRRGWQFQGQFHDIIRELAHTLNPDRQGFNFDLFFPADSWQIQLQIA